MRVADLLKNKGDKIISIPAGCTVADAVKVLCDHKIGAAVVLDEDGSLVGILSERDVTRGLGLEGAALLDQPATKLMTSDVMTCKPEDSTDAIMRTMTDGRFRHMPVMKDGALCGIISIGDVVKGRIDDLENEASAMREYIAGSG